MNENELVWPEYTEFPVSAFSTMFLVAIGPEAVYFYAQLRSRARKKGQVAVCEVDSFCQGRLSSRTVRRRLAVLGTAGMIKVEGDTVKLAWINNVDSWVVYLDERAEKLERLMLSLLERSPEVEGIHDFASEEDADEWETSAGVDRISLRVRLRMAESFANVSRRNKYASFKDSEAWLQYWERSWRAVLDSEENSADITRYEWDMRYQEGDHV